MVKNLLYTEEGLLQEIKERAQAEGVATREEWDAMVEDVIEEHREVGEMHDDEDLENLEDVLKQRFHDYEIDIEAE